MELRKEIEGLEKKILSELSISSTAKEIEDVRVKYLGRKGIITQRLKNIKNLNLEERPFYGKEWNRLKLAIEEAISKRGQDLVTETGSGEKFFDWTMPGDRKWLGHLNPLTKTMDEIIEVFLRMGFSVEYGPDIETDFYNFGALNMPKDHPSRDIQDTFYLGSNLLLRTQTSPVQVRVMESRKPPIRIISPGRCYRVDNFDSSHSPVFHQVEGLMVDTDVSFADLKGILDEFFKAFFEVDELPTRFRNSFFPFTEPSAETDIQCVHCKGEGCKVCSHTGWLEVMGCGMVHPNVLKMSNIDPEKYTGFAFGFGVERLAMLRYGIDDLRIFFENDLRFLRQFN